MNIVYYENTPYYTPETYSHLFYYAERYGKETMREYFNTFRDQFESITQANESLRNIDNKMYISSEIIIARKLENYKKIFADKYGFSGNFYVSTVASGVDIVYAREEPGNQLTQPVKRLESKCTNGFYKKYTRGRVVRPINEYGYYLKTKCAWKYHLTKTHNPIDAFNSTFDDFGNMDAVHAVLTMEYNVRPIISELWSITGEGIQRMLIRNRNKQNLVQISPTSFYTIFKDDVELIG